MSGFRFEVEGLKCQGCVSKIKSALEGGPKIKEVSVDLEQMLVHVSGEELSGMGLKSKIESCGFPVLGMIKE